MLELDQLLRQLTDRLHVTLHIEIVPADTPPNHHDSPPIDSNAPTDAAHNVSDSFTILETYGIQGDETLLTLATRYPPHRIKQCINAIDTMTTKVRSKPAYLRRALEQGWYKRGGKKRRK